MRRTVRFVKVGPQLDCKAVTRNHLRGRASRTMRLRRTPHAPSFWQPRSTPVGAMLPSNASRHVPPRRMCGRAPKGSRETLGYLDHLIHRTWRWPLGSRGDDLSQEDDVPSIIARTLQTHPRTGRFGTPLWLPGEGKLAPAFVETLVETGRWAIGSAVSL